MAAELKQILIGLLTSDNSIRKSAESQLNSTWLLDNPSQLLQGLVEICLTEKEDAIIRKHAALLLRKFISKHSFIFKDEENQNVWPRLAPQLQIQIQNSILKCLEIEKDSTVRHAICEAIAQISRASMDTIGWPALFNALTHCALHSDPIFRESTFWIISANPEILLLEINSNGLFAISNIPVVSETFIRALSDSNLLVRMAAMKAAVSLVVFPELDKNSRADLINSLLISFGSVLQDVVNQSEYLVTALELFVELVENSPKSLKPILSQLFTFILDIQSNTNNDSASRKTALELGVSLIENAPVMCRKLNPEILSRFISNTIDMMSEIEDDPEWYTTEQLEDADESEIAIAAEQSIDRIACSLGGNHVFPHALLKIQEFISSSVWSRRYAAFMCIGTIAEGCRSIVEQHLEDVITAVNNSVNEQHPRVIYAVCNALGQLSTDCSPVFQESFHQAVMSYISTQMDRLDQPRVATHAAAALVNFCEEAPDELVKPYIPTLLGKVGRLLSQNLIYAKEQAVTSLAVLAKSAGSDFDSFYGEIMPHLMAILENETSKDRRVFRGKAIECAALIATAVSKEVFAPDSHRMIDILSIIQKSATEPDDPQTAYLLAAWARLCSVLKEDFLEFLPFVMEPLLAAAEYKPEFATLSAGEDPESQGYPEDDGWEFTELDGQKIGIKTTAMEEKYTAIEMLIRYARSLKGSFNEYAPRIFDIVLPLLKFYFHEGVRFASASLIPLLFECMKSGNADTSFIDSKWIMAASSLLHVVLDDVDQEMIIKASIAFTECLEIMGKDCLLNKKFSGIFPVAPEYADLDLLDFFAEAINEEIGEILCRTNDRQKVRQDSDMYDTEMEGELAEQEELDEMMMGELSRMVHTVFKTHGDTFIPTFQKYFLQNIQGMILEQNIRSNGGKSAELQGKQWAICVFDDFFDFCSLASCWQFRDCYWNPLSDALVSSNPDIRQASSYGIGTLAVKFYQEKSLEILNAWLPMFVHACNVLSVALADELSLSSSHKLARENAVSALGKIIHYVMIPCIDSKISISPLDISALIDGWLRVFWFEGDEEEAPHAYIFLLKLISMKRPEVPKNMERIVFALIFGFTSNVLQSSVVWHGETAQNVHLMVGKTLKNIWPQVPLEVRNQIVAKFDAETGEKMNILLSSSA